MSQIELITPEIQDYIQKRVGNDRKKMKFALRYYKYNIPERFWFKGIVTEKNDLQDCFDALENDDWVVVVGANIKWVGQFICEVLKMFAQKNHSIYFNDFFELASRPNFDGQAYNKFMYTLQQIDVVGISGIKFGEMFNKHSEQFVMFCNAMYNAQFQKKFIFGVEKLPEDDERSTFADYYGEFGELIELGDWVVKHV